MTRTRIAWPSAAAVRAGAALGLWLAAGAARAEAGPGILHQMNDAMARLAERVTPAVVQIQVSGFRPAGPGGRVESALVSRQHAVGSGVIVDPDGYILTNSHVVHGAQRIQVLLPPPPAPGSPGGEEAGQRLFDARVIGAEPNADLALLKIEARNLPTLSLRTATPVRQGELVFAIGSPEGLTRTMTMGIVGAVARPVEADQPMVFIQTDAPINPGNSGGPLVNVDGALVGINTFILSESGGSQGLGFAIPAAMVQLVYDGLRKDGHVHRIELGLATESINATLAAALGLPRDWGVLVSDVALGGAARAAGVEIGDVIESFDGRPIDSAAAMTTAWYLHRPGEPATLVLHRGGRHLTVKVEAREVTRPADLAELASPETSLVRRLGILGVDVSPRLQGVISGLRVGTGVVVAARTLDATGVDSGLQPGDVIHAVNRTAVESLADLRQVLRTIKAGQPVALQIEREGKMAYLAFEME
ncbi:MAG TPA: trypsin-like peptidase domain-containing protein [Anaeromyxobacter sp.]|nr:trypsin-like peptidase domain-containing protein [Anaeromyxobacter sp.]